MTDIRHLTSGIRHPMSDRRLLFLVCGLMSVVCGLALSGCRRAGQRLPAVDAQGRKIVEISMFEGGFGSDFQKRLAREYEQLHPDVMIKISASPRNTEVLRPRFIAGTPPDVVWGSLPMWTLIEEGQVYPLDDALNSPAYDQPNKLWKDTIRPEVLDMYKSEKDGKTYGVVGDFSLFGFWYNVDMFRKNGWEVPKTWDELLAICEKAQQTPIDPKRPELGNIDPIAFQGRYPGYIMGIAYDLVERIGGPQAWADMENLKPKTWESDGVIQAFTLCQELRRKNYIPASYMGMSHMEAQMEFVQGRAALVPCGTWLATEMRQSTPENFHMDFFPTPMPTGGQGDPTAIGVGGAVWFVPSQANYPEIGADYLKFMTSLKHSREFVQVKWSPTATIGSDEDVPPVLRGAVQAMNEAHFTYTHRLSDWYFSWGQFEGQAALDLMSLKKTPREVSAFLEREADFLRNDPRTEKHHMPVPGPKQQVVNGEWRVASDNDE